MRIVFFSVTEIVNVPVVSSKYSRRLSIKEKKICNFFGVVFDVQFPLLNFHPVFWEILNIYAYFLGGRGALLFLFFTFQCISSDISFDQISAIGRFTATSFHEHSYFCG